MRETRQTVAVVEAIPSIVASWGLLFFAACTLPSRGIGGRLLRAATFVALLFPLLDLTLNRRYTFGSIIVDVWWPSLAWPCLAKAIDFCIVSLFDEDAPHWIVPDPAERPQDPREVPRAWRTLPHPPPFSLSRLLYGLDTVLTFRQGTSVVFSHEQRAFDWSLRALRDPATPFGRPETGPAVAALQLATFAGGAWGIRFIATSPDITGIRDLSLPAQLLLALLTGSMIFLTTAFTETLFLLPLVRRGIIPATAFLPLFQLPITSKGLRDFWGRRWHRVPRRSLTRVGSLIPGGRTALGNVLGAFFVSGIMHAFVLARSVPVSRLSTWAAWREVFFSPGPLLFFTAQGVGLVVETALFPEREGECPIVTALRRVWLWAVLLGTGRWYLDMIIERGYFSQQSLDSVMPGELYRLVLKIIGCGGA